MEVTWSGSRIRSRIISLSCHAPTILDARQPDTPTCSPHFAHFWGDVLRKNNHLDWSDLSEDGPDLSDFLLLQFWWFSVFPHGWWIHTYLVNSTLTRTLSSWRDMIITLGTAITILGATPTSSQMDVQSKEWDPTQPTRYLVILIARLYSAWFDIHAVTMSRLSRLADSLIPGIIVRVRYCSCCRALQYNEARTDRMPIRAMWSLRLHTRYLLGTEYMPTWVLTASMRWLKVQILLVTTHLVHMVHEAKMLGKWLGWSPTLPSWYYYDDWILVRLRSSFLTAFPMMILFRM